MTETKEKGSYTYWLDNGTEFTLKIDKFWENIYKGQPRERLYEEYQQMLNIVKKVSKDKIICDVGVNFGLFSVPVSLSGYKLVGFEPVLDNFDSSVENMASNNCSNWNLFQYALSDKSETSTIFIPSCPDNASLNKEAAVANMHSKEYREEEIKCVRFDDWIKENPQFSNIGLIKLDCQGKEFDILNNSQEFLKKAKDIYLIVEYEEHLLKMGYSYADLDNLLISLGFKQVGIISNDKVFYKQ